MTIYLEFGLVDVSSKLPQLKRRPGITTWRPSADRSAAVTFGTYEEFMSSSLEDTLKARMSEGHWPPKNVETLNLPRWYVLYFVFENPSFLTNTYSIRIYPHLQDSGGFFVAVLERVREPSSDSEITL